MILFCLQSLKKYYYSKKSAADYGTLYNQLHSAIDRTNLVSKPLKDTNACDDLFVHITNAHLLAAAMEVLGMQDGIKIYEVILLPLQTYLIFHCRTHVIKRIFKTKF